MISLYLYVTAAVIWYMQDDSTHSESVKMVTCVVAPVLVLPITVFILVQEWWKNRKNAK